MHVLEAHAVILKNIVHRRPVDVVALYTVMCSADATTGSPADAFDPGVGTTPTHRGRPAGGGGGIGGVGDGDGDGLGGAPQSFTFLISQPEMQCGLLVGAQTAGTLLV